MNNNVKNLMLIILVAALLAGIIVGLFLTRGKINSLQTQLSNLQTHLTKINDTSTTILKHTTEVNEKSTTLVNITQLASNPESYLSKQVFIFGKLHNIFTIPEIKLPYNSVLAYENVQIGVLTSEKIKEGSNVIVRGIVAKGFQERLTNKGWVKDKEVYYIVALEVLEV